MTRFPRKFLLQRKKYVHEGVLFAEWSFVVMPETLGTNLT